MARELAHLAQSNFRARFRLNAKDRETAQTKGDALLRQHALELLTTRLAPADEGASRLYRPARHGLLLPHLSDEVARHYARTRAHGC